VCFYLILQTKNSVLFILCVYDSCTNNRKDVIKTVIYWFMSQRQQQPQKMSFTSSRSLVSPPVPFGSLTTTTATTPVAAKFTAQINKKEQENKYNNNKIKQQELRQRKQTKQNNHFVSGYGNKNANNKYSSRRYYEKGEEEEEDAYDDGTGDLEDYEYYDSEEEEEEEDLYIPKESKKNINNAKKEKKKEPKRRRTPSPEDTKDDVNTSTKAIVTTVNVTPVATPKITVVEDTSEIKQTQLQKQKQGKELVAVKPKHVHANGHANKHVALSEEQYAAMLTFLSSNEVGINTGIKDERTRLFKSPSLIDHYSDPQNITAVKSQLWNIAKAENVSQDLLDAYTAAFDDTKKEKSTRWYPTIATNLQTGKNKDKTTTVDFTHTVNIAQEESAVTMDVNVVSDAVYDIKSPLVVSSSVLKQRMLELYPNHKGQVLLKDVVFNGDATYNDVNCSVNIRHSVMLTPDDIVALWIAINNNCTLDEFVQAVQKYTAVTKTASGNNKGVLGEWAFAQVNGGTYGSGIKNSRYTPITVNLALKGLTDVVEYVPSFLKKGKEKPVIADIDRIGTLPARCMLMAYLVCSFSLQSELKYLTSVQRQFKDTHNDFKDLLELTSQRTWIPVDFASKNNNVLLPFVHYSQYWAVKKFAESLQHMRKHLKLTGSQEDFNKYVQSCILVNKETNEIEWIAVSTELLLKDLLRQQATLQQYPVRPWLGSASDNLSFEFYVPPSALSLNPRLASKETREVATKKGFHLDGTITMHYYLLRTSKIKEQEEKKKLVPTAETTTTSTASTSTITTTTTETPLVAKEESTKKNVDDELLEMLE